MANYFVYIPASRTATKHGETPPLPSVGRGDKI